MAETSKSSPSTNTIMMIEEDRISRLPDALIHCIFSFIDTKYAVQTCVLSKRWIDVWKSLPFLNFYVKKSKSDEWMDFTDVDFADRVLLLRDDCSIQRLRVNWYSCRVFNKSINRWTDIAVMHNVQEVTLELGQSQTEYSNFRYIISPRLLTCKSLIKLTFRVYHDDPFGNPEVILPESMSLPQLKFMCLHGFYVLDAELLKRLFSSCPALETLSMINCDIKSDNQRMFTIESLSLKQFAYTYQHDIGNPCVYRRWHMVPKIIKLSAPNLNSFSCESYLTKEYHLPNGADQLSDVKLNILCGYEYENNQLPAEGKVEHPKRLVKLLVAVNKVKRLDLSPGFLEVLSSASELLNCRLHCLCNLQYLKLETWFTGRSLRMIAYLLKISPNIKTLILKLNWPMLVDAGDDWEEESSVPGMLSHLNTVRIEEMIGCDAELKLLSFLLKYAKVMDEVSLYPCLVANSPPRVINQFMDKLTALPRASPGAKMRWVATDT